MANDNSQACSRSVESLSAYVDGDLSPGESHALRAHLSGCPRCAAAVDELGGLVNAARKLERPEPPLSLWSAVEGALARPDRPWWLSLRMFGIGALAGAAAVSVIALGLSAGRTPHHPVAAMAAPPPRAALVADDPLLDEAEAEFAAAAATYEQSIKKLRGFLAREEPRWSPNERARCTERLAQLDEAIARSREIAHRSPGDSLGNEQLFAAYQQKIAFLAEAVHRGGTFREGEPSP